LGIEEQMTIKFRDRATFKKPLKYRAETFYSECSDSQSYKDAMHSENVEKWRETMSEEMSSLQKNETWKLVKLLRNKKALNNGWVYRTKTKKNGEVDRLKARLVSKGYAQEYGIYFQEIFSLVVKYDYTSNTCYSSSQKFKAQTI